MPLSAFATPPRFLTARVEVLDEEPRLTTLCAGFERGEWRQEEFVQHLFMFLLEFAFTWTHLQDLNSATATQMLQDAARRVYKSDPTGRRGEFGELLLHAVLRANFGSEPAVAKLFYKSGDNDTVKGFDCVHIVENESNEIELWLGEAKFYSEIGAALASALDSLDELTDTRRLKREFALIRAQVDRQWPYAEHFTALTEGRSLDEVFEVLRIPVLLTYNSDSVIAHDAIDDGYLQALDVEVRHVFDRLKSSGRLPQDIYVHLILVPLRDKEQFQRALHEQLVRYQVSA